jgi:hypothetical protein
VSTHAAPAIAGCAPADCSPVETAALIEPAARPVALPAAAERPAAAARPRLRLVTSSAPAAEITEIHGRGGPASCQCRACAIARHPASLPRLTVVR